MSGLIQCRACNQQIITVPEQETRVNAQDYWFPTENSVMPEGYQAPTCRDIGYDDSFLETPYLDAAEDEQARDAGKEQDEDQGPYEEEEVAPGALQYYDDPYDLTERFDPKTVAAIQSAPGYDIANIGTGGVASKLKLAEKRSLLLTKMRQQLVSTQNDCEDNLAGASGDTSESGMEEAEARVNRIIARSGDLMAMYDGLANDFKKAQQEHNISPDVTNELLARNAFATEDFFTIYPELDRVLNPGAVEERESQRELVKVKRVAEAYKRQYNAVHHYLDPLKDHKGKYVEAVNAMMTYAAAYDVADTVLFLKGVRTMDAMWRVSLASKVTGFPSGALEAMDKVPWREIGEMASTTHAWDACMQSASSDHDNEVCGNMYQGGDKMETEMNKLNKLAHQLHELTTAE